jgi:nicotinate dehydrogenase subunit A
LGAPSSTLKVNGRVVHLAVDGAVPLLTVLRNDLGLNGPKYGCGLGECGACTVLVGGVAARACALPLAGVAGREVTTLEGLGAAGALHPLGHGELHPVQRAFIATQAAQCGYCLNGMIMATVALLRRQPKPTDAQARAALSHNLCRCGTHLEILAAVQLAARLVAEAAPAVAAETAAPTAGPAE